MCTSEAYGEGGVSSGCRVLPPGVTVLSSDSANITGHSLRCWLNRRAAAIFFCWGMHLASLSALLCGWQGSSSPVERAELLSGFTRTLTPASEGVSSQPSLPGASFLLPLWESGEGQPSAGGTLTDGERDHVAGAELLLEGMSALLFLRSKRQSCSWERPYI